MPPEAWIPITLAAAFFQNIRSTLQNRMAGRSTVHSSAYVRFLYALPFAWLYVFAVVEDPGSAFLSRSFWLYGTGGAISQIVATTPDSRGRRNTGVLERT